MQSDLPNSPLPLHAWQLRVGQSLQFATAPRQHKCQTRADPHGPRFFQTYSTDGEGCPNVIILQLRKRK